MDVGLLPAAVTYRIMHQTTIYKIYDGPRLRQCIAVLSRLLGVLMLCRFAKILLGILIVASIAHAQTQNMFFQPPVFPGGGPYFTADLNLDGKADLIGSDGTVLLGNGDGTFKTGTPWTTNAPNFTQLAAVADFNGDGKPDLLLRGNQNCCFMYVLLGNGDGTFQAPITSSNMGTTLDPVFAVDVNGDGKPDLVGLGAGGLWVFFGKGDGTFSVPGTQYPISLHGLQLVLGDFNGDHQPDILVATQAADLVSAGSILVFLGNGDGTFRPPIISAGVVVPTSLAVGDVNGDSKVDLVLDSATPSGSSGQIMTLLGNGDGSFKAPTMSGGLTSDGSLVLVDLNGDGKLDLLFSYTPFTEVALGNGDGTFALKHTYFGGGQMVTADFNGDGKTDIAVSNQMLFGNGDGSFLDNPATVVPGPGILKTALAADFNGDGFPDIAAISDNSTNSLYILLNDGTGQFSLAHTYPFLGTYSEQPFSLATGDLNGDGKLDLVTIIPDPITAVWSLSVLLGNGDGSFAAHIISPTTLSGYPPPDSIAIADFNGDRKQDLALLDLSTNLVVFPGNGDGTFGAPLTTFAGPRPNSLVVGDFNNDGIPDVADASAAGLGILLGKGDGTFHSAIFPNSGITQVVAVADLNGDGNLDLLTFSNGGVQVLLGNGDGTFIALPAMPQSSSLYVAVADVNGDGKLDLVTGYGVNVLLGNGDGTFGNIIPILPPHSVGATPIPTVGDHYILAADFNGDKKTDIVVDVSSLSAGVITLINKAAPATPDFLLTAKPFLPTIVAPGSSASSTISLAVVAGFSDSIALSCTGLPSGATCSFAPSTITGPGTSTLTITTNSSIPVGSYPVIVMATSAALSHSVGVNLTVATSPGANAVTLAPVALTFTAQAFGTTSSAQAVELTNTGQAPLSISSISLTGQNSADFAQINSCGNGIASGASCTVRVTFSPAGLGSRSATLSVSDTGTGSPRMVALNGTAPDFSMSPGSTQPVSVPAGQTASYVLTLTPSAGFNQSVAFTCAGNPTLTTCTVSPDPVSLNGSTAVTANVSIITTAAKAAFTVPFAKFPPPRVNHRLWEPVAIFAAFLMVLATMLTWRGKRRLITAPFAAIVALIFVVITLAACGGGSSSSGGGGGGSPGTPVGTYTITITATTGSGATASSHTTALTLTVTQ
jgi:hypothetical protein